MGSGLHHAQVLTERLPPPPSGLLDDKKILARSPALQRQVIDEIKKLESAHGYRLFLVIEASLIATTPSVLAAELQEQWTPGGNGLVIVFESDTGKMGFGRGLESGEGIVAGKEGIPSFHLVEIINKSLVASRGIDTSDRFIHKLVLELCGNFRDYFLQKELPEKNSRSLRLALATIGALSLLALASMGVGWMMGKAEKKQSRVLKFPEVQVPERLGAPYGGGGGGSSYFGKSTQSTK